ncbi:MULTISPECIES: hypothetical protein [Delftia]|uniref:Uncharacterized protein n=2 Tax=Delftia TaxID=80865 RepID=A0A7T2W068_DELAC|nr:MULTISPECIES: hypothetical protein [Delftia]MBB1653389.1 hypothetical protein [Delftia sp. UME58]QPS09042.1 hypothetical protein I6G66_03030 [Delftia acidovorans]
MVDASNASPSRNAIAPPAPTGLNAQLWATSTVEQQQVMQRIAQQRERLKARSAAVAQARALSRSATQVQPDAPLVERAITFARLHPVAVAVAAGAALMVGPRKLLRFGTTVMPLILRWQQRRG